MKIHPSVTVMIYTIIMITGVLLGAVVIESSDTPTSNFIEGTIIKVFGDEDGYVDRQWFTVRADDGQEFMIWTRSRTCALDLGRWIQKGDKIQFEYTGTLKVKNEISSIECIEITQRAKEIIPISERREY